MIKKTLILAILLFQFNSYAEMDVIIYEKAKIALRDTAKGLAMYDLCGIETGDFKVWILEKMIVLGATEHQLSMLSGEYDLQMSITQSRVNGYPTQKQCKENNVTQKSFDDLFYIAQYNHNKPIADLFMKNLKENNPLYSEQPPIPVQN